MKGIGGLNGGMEPGIIDMPCIGGGIICRGTVGAPGPKGWDGMNGPTIGRPIPPGGPGNPGGMANGTLSDGPLAGNAKPEGIVGGIGGGHIGGAAAGAFIDAEDVFGGTEEVGGVPGMLKGGRGDPNGGGATG